MKWNNKLANLLGPRGSTTSTPCLWLAEVHAMAEACSRIEQTTRPAVAELIERTKRHQRLVERWRFEAAEALMNQPPGRAGRRYLEAVQAFDQVALRFLGERRGESESFGEFATRMLPLFETRETIVQAQRRNGLIALAELGEAA